MNLQTQIHNTTWPFGNEGGRLVVLGGGESGVGAALLARQKGWEVFLSDSGNLIGKWRAELDTAGIAYESGGHTVDNILAADCVVKSPGIPQAAPLVQELRKQQKLVMGEIEFAWHYRPQGSRVIGITGSNGKSTTTVLTGHILKEDGANVAVGGNIGYSFARLLLEEPRDWYVLELSSFQLDDIIHFRPEIAMLLNITPDHLDRYEYDFSKYAASKFRIALNQTSNDIFIINADDPVITAYLAAHRPAAQILPFTMNPENIEVQDNGAFADDEHIELHVDGEQTNLLLSQTGLQGRHNRYNGMAAGIGAAKAGIRRASIRGALATFSSLEHRLEHAGTVKGVTFINDSKATNLNSVWFALESMRTPVVLILGGQDKGNDYAALEDMVREKVKAIVCLGRDNRPILEAFEPLGKEVIETSTATDAVAAAFSLAEAGEVVLLSPGCASFDLFEDYQDRGRQYKAAVAELAAKNI